MTKTETLKDEVRRAVVALEVLAGASCSIPAFAFAKVNYSLAACEIAAKITGCDPFLCKMLNQSFRDAACELAFESAAREIAARKMGLVKDPRGLCLPDDLWRQALPEAKAALVA